MPRSARAARWKSGAGKLMPGAARGARGARQRAAGGRRERGKGTPPLKGRERPQLAARADRDTARWGGDTYRRGPRDKLYAHKCFPLFKCMHDEGEVIASQPREATDHGAAQPRTYGIQSAYTAH